MDIIFVNKQNFWERTKFFVNNGDVKKKKNGLDCL